MRRLWLVALLLCLPGLAVGQDYIRYYPPGSTPLILGPSSDFIQYIPLPFNWYVDSASGSDLNDGKSRGTAFQTIGGLLGETLLPGQRVALSGTFRETLTVPENGLTFAGYGGGATISAVPVMSTVAEESGGIFASGFEQETNSFNVDFSGKGDTGGALTVVDGGRTGAKAMKIVFNGTLINAYAYKTIAAQTEAYARVWIKIDKSWSMAAAGQYANVFSLYDTGTTATAFRCYLYSLTPSDAPPRMLVQFTTNGGGVTSLGTTVMVSPEVWHMIEIHWKQDATVGGASFSFDGVELASDFTKNTTPYAPNTLMVGGFLGLTSPPNGATLYFDDVKVAATPLGDGVTRLNYAVDLNSKSGLVFNGLDLENGGVSNFKSGGATFTAQSTRSLSPEPWTAPNDPTLPSELTELHDIGFAISGSAIAPDGTMYLHDATSKVKKSTNGGASWTDVKTFPDGGLIGNAMWVDSRGYIHAFPNGGASSSGIWTSTDAGANWTQKLDLSGLPQPAGIWGIDEDANGNIYAGAYTSHAAGAAGEIYKSTDGLNWSKVYDNDADRHVHGITVDQATGYIYATLGDNGAPWNSPIILKSTDAGANWARTLNSLPQMVGITSTTGARLFGTDTPGSRAALYRTTDDTAYSEVLSVPRNMDCLWMRRDPDTGYLFAGFGGATVTSGTAGVWRSKDDGLTWDQVLAIPITAAGDGTGAASNIVGGKIILSVVSGGVNVGGGVYSVR